MNRQFGRIPSPFDHRDYNLRNFIPLGADLSLDEIVERNWEYPHASLDQLETQHCLGFSMANFGINYPVHTEYTTEDAHKFYYMCKELEGDPKSENGAYMRSGAEVLLALNKIEAYAFAPDIATIKWWIMNGGCMMVGSMWLQGMMTPDEDNIIHATGNSVGGHAYLINEWTKDNLIGIQNSWGDAWGEKGKAYISQTDFEKLLTFYGEVITCVELDDAIVPVPEEPIEIPVVIPPSTNKGCLSMITGLFQSKQRRAFSPDNAALIHDISHWQGDLRKYWQPFWDKGCRAIIIKATEGYAYYNYFQDTIKQAKEFGFLVGSYHYFRQQIIGTDGARITCDPIKQAQNYFDWVTKSGVKMDLPPAIDIENGNNPFLNFNSIDKFLWKTEALFKRVPFIYSNPSILKGLAKVSWERYPLWIANYATSPLIPAPWKDFTLWQFSDKITYNMTNEQGTIVSRKPIDHNWFNGNMADLLRFCNLNEPPVPPVPSTPKQVETTVSLRGRTKPVYMEGDSALIFKPNTTLDVLNEPMVFEDASGIMWLPIRMWVSNRYVKEV